MYEYDTDKDDALTSITARNNVYNHTVDFAYDSARRLNKITRNGFDYDFTYDGMGRMKTVSVAGAQYCENEYDTSTDTTTVTTTYNGGEKLKVTTDKHQNPVKKSYINANSVETVLAEAEYDNLGKVTKYIDKTEQKEYTYTYNELGNVESVKLNGVPYKQYTYDSHGRETALSIPSHNYTYTYERTPAQSGQSRKIYPHNEKVGSTVFGRFGTTVTKDNIGRRSTKSWNLISYDIRMKDRYTYLDTAERLTHFVSKLEQMADGSAVDRTYDFTYDDDGNIIEIKIDGVTTFTYTYDKLGQLTREDNRLLNTTYTFTYNLGGNITSRKKYAYTTGTVGEVLATDTYTYDTVNKDRLVSYNGQAITYDGKGNPLTYKGNTLTWDRVRLLSGYGSNTYAYNADGIRRRKNNTNYTLDGSNIIREYDANGKDIYFNYDLDGVCGFRIGGVDYFYRKNLQGDITDIYCEDGTKYASYTYDAWGNCTITLDVCGIGTLNPFRYRGYYYDSETNLYYLKSRYYDPATGRFLNQDELVDNRSVLGYNMYAYCWNNPVNKIDNSGESATAVAAGAAGVAALKTAFEYLLIIFAAVVGGTVIGERVGTTAASLVKEDEIVSAKEKTAYAEPPQVVYIYRYGFAEEGISKLVPSEVDRDHPETGLSFSLRWKPGSATTTMDIINATGVLRAVQDKTNHVAVFPIGGTIEDWYNQGVGSIWTQTLYSIVWPT